MTFSRLIDSARCPLWANSIMLNVIDEMLERLMSFACAIKPISYMTLARF